MFKKGSIKTFVLGLLMLLSHWAAAQYVKIGDGSYAGTLGGPMIGSTTKDTQNSRFAYIIPRAELGNMAHFDSIASIEFYRITGSAPNTSTNCKIWLQNTTRTDFGTGKLNFITEANNSTLVFNSSPSNYIGGNEKFYRLPFNLKNFVFDTTQGENLVLLVEYNQTKRQGSALQWYFEGPATVSSYAQNQVKYGIATLALDSLPSSSSYHPTMIFNFPKINEDLAIIKVYTLGKMPLPLGKPDSVQVLLRNVGKRGVIKFPLYTHSQGYNKQKDSFYVSLLSGEESFFNVPSLNPLRGGLDTIYVECADKNKSNNSGFSFRLGNPNVYSYRDVTKSPAPGGIGFNGTTGDFVARFFSNSPKNINQITVSFGSGGEPFKVGIWQCDSVTKKPSTLTFQSDTLSSKTGNYILDIKTPVVVNGSFFVGVRQLGNNNVAFGYQMESPVRPKTFYYVAPTNTTNWIDFAPDAPYKFLIEPRLQADIDIAALSLDQPKDSINKYSNDTIAPEGLVGNIGIKNATDSFEIRCEIWFGANRQYSQIIRDTLSSGQKRKYRFPKTYIPSSFGEHRALLIVKKLGDQVLDNDTQTRVFYVGVKRDVMINTVYEPTNGSGYNYKTDTIMPMANIQNIGFDNSPTFTVRCRMFQGTKVVYNQIQFLTLAKFQSRIIYWPTYKCSDTGKIRVVFTTESTTDVFRNNDTQSRTIFIRKIVDIGIDSLRSPSEAVFHAKGKTLPIKYYIYNDGLIAAFNVPFYCSIFTPNGNRVYFDSVKAYLQGLFGSDISMPKSFTPNGVGLYKIVVKTQHNLDLFNDNDSMVRYFHVGKPHDFLAISIKKPVSNEVVSIGKPSVTPKLLVKNNGYLKNTAPFVCEVFYNGNRIYYDIKTASLDTGQTDTIYFSATLRPMNVGFYTIRCYANLSSDIDRSNDTITQYFTAVVGKDAFPVSARLNFDSAVYDLSDTLQWAKIKIQNQGADTINKVLVNISIFEKGQRTAFISKVTRLKGNASDTLFFQLDHRFLATGQAEMLVYTSSFEDQNLYNDSLWIPIRVEIQQDLSIQKALQPGVTSILIKNDSLRYPTIKLSNLGSINSTKENRIFYTISQPASNKFIFTDTFIIPAILPLDSRELTSSKPLSFKEAGAYLLTCFALKSKDGVNSNDTLQYVLFVQEPLSIGPTFTIQDSSALLQTQIYPIPADPVIHVKASTEMGDFMLILTDSKGRVVFEKTKCNGATIISTNTFVSGFYTLKLHCAMGSLTQSIVIQHP